VSSNQSPQALAERGIQRQTEADHGLVGQQGQHTGPVVRDRDQGRHYMACTLAEQGADQVGGGAGESFDGLTAHAGGEVKVFEGDQAGKNGVLVEDVPGAAGVWGGVQKLLSAVEIQFIFQYVIVQ